MLFMGQKPIFSEHIFKYNALKIKFRNILFIGDINSIKSFNIINLNKYNISVPEKYQTDQIVIF